MTQVTLKTNLSDIIYPTLMQKLFSMRYQWWVNSCEYNNCVVNLPKASQGLPTSPSKAGLVWNSMDRTVRLQVMSQRQRNFDENHCTCHDLLHRFYPDKKGTPSYSISTKKCWNFEIFWISDLFNFESSISCRMKYSCEKVERIQNIDCNAGANHYPNCETFLTRAILK